MTVLKNSIFAYGIIATVVFVTVYGSPVAPTLDHERKFADYEARLKESLKILRSSSSDWHIGDVFNGNWNKAFRNPRDDMPLPVSTQGTTKRPRVLVSTRFKPATEHYDFTEFNNLIKTMEEVARNASNHWPIDYKFPEPWEAFDRPVTFPDTPRHFPTQGTTKRPRVVTTRTKTTPKPMMTRNREDTNYWFELGRNLRNLETWTLNSAKTSFTAVYNWLRGN